MENLDPKRIKELEEEIEGKFPLNVKTIRYENTIIKITENKQKPLDIYAKKNDEKHKHYHLYVVNEKPYFHETDEKALSQESRHTPINLTKFGEDMAKDLQTFFEKMYPIDPNDEKWKNELVFFLVWHSLYVKKVIRNGKEVQLGQRTEIHEKLLPNVDLSKNQMGFFENENILLVNDKKMYVIEI
ncbi:hypothetical protein [Nitrosopumilus sp.]|uniref:hypothetical protein n=1 Tax=Nitrosopumilus sp. TaxID=2024843 RepID=UPI00247E2E1C|nr:hypothetical protein [Nitrosopumilus sp.]MCV0431530.1 hypothetical protein [Nitrosopumilus sp.]